jgi:hypothetical protein
MWVTFLWMLAVKHHVTSSFASSGNAGIYATVKIMEEV